MFFFNYLEITSLVTDMHSSADKIIELFSTAPGADDMSTRADRSLACNPAKLCYVVKQAVREAAIGETLTVKARVFLFLVLPILLS